MPGLEYEFNAVSNVRLYVNGGNKCAFEQKARLCSSMQTIDNHC